MLTLEPFSKDQGRSAVQPTRGSHQVSFLVPHGFTHPSTRTHVRLLGPCFKTGRMGSPQVKARRTQVPRHVKIDVGFPPQSRQRHDHEHSNNPRFDRRHDPLRSAQRADRQTVFESFHMRPRHIVDPHSLPSRQFQALFDSLFKVLFIFPSRYLFTIGLSPVFSLGRSLPPNLGCTPKQPDSPTTPHDATGSELHGALTLSSTPFQGT